MGKAFGHVNTPKELATLLSKWAIRSPNDLVLDLGVGEGVFVFAAFNQLLDLGAERKNAQNQIFGSDIRLDAIKRLNNEALEEGLEFPKISHSDFFDYKFPNIDVLIGNPPYIRRSQMQNAQVNHFRQSVLTVNDSIDEDKLSQLTDLYIYFLLYAFPFVKPEGRVAVVVADSWLNVRYGQVLKKYFMDSFEINHLISFDRRIFYEAQVKPLLLLATKKTKEQRNKLIAFSRILNGLQVNELNLQSIQNGKKVEDVATIYISSKSLEESSPWATHFKISDILDLIEGNPHMIPINQLGNIRIGIQSLAKNFLP